MNLYIHAYSWNDLIWLNIRVRQHLNYKLCVIISNNNKSILLHFIRDKIKIQDVKKIRVSKFKNLQYSLKVIKKKKKKIESIDFRT